MRAAPSCQRGTITTRNGPLRDLTTLFKAARDGDAAAIGEIYSHLYAELRAMAHLRIKRLQDRSIIDTTSLVHESFLKLLKTGTLDVDDRNHFLAYAASVMRSVVVDFIRHNLTQQRGGGQLHVTLNSGVFNSVASPADELIRLDEFLNALKAVDQKLVNVVEMRYFGALEIPEIAESMGIAERTVRRYLDKARLLFAAESA